MNVGGPAQHVSILGGRLDARGYDTLLVAGKVGSGEASATHLAAERGARLLTLEHLGPEVRPLADLRALGALIRIIRRFRPALVHTHTAKAGFLGRLAAVLAGGRRPQIVHTYHGHVLKGYFGPVKTGVYRGMEWAGGRVSDALVGVSQATVDELVCLRVAPRERFRVVPLGLELDPFLALPERPSVTSALRLLAHVEPGEVLVTLAGRLVPIKRVDVALEAVALARDQGAPIRLLVVGDGELRRDLELRASELGIGPIVCFAGFQRDMPQVVAASDIALLTSDNEGTPVALIEAAAGARPAVATLVGGVGHVVREGTGRLCPAGDARSLADALGTLAGDDALRLELGRQAREHVRARFDARRLVDDVEALYQELLAGAPA